MNGDMSHQRVAEASEFSADESISLPTVPIYITQSIIVSLYSRYEILQVEFPSIIDICAINIHLCW